MVMVEGQWSSAGERYAYELIDACPVCVSHWHAEVDEQLIAGRSPSEVVGNWSYSAGPSVAEVREHVARGHVRVTRTPGAGGGVFDSAAGSPGRDAAPAAGQDIAGLAKTILGALALRIEAGEVQPSMRDGLNAANLLARLDVGNDPVGYVDVNTLEQVMAAWMDALRPVLTKAQMNEFGRTLDNNPLLNKLEQEDRRRLGL
jgi:hypothetical protein